MEARVVDFPEDFGKSQFLQGQDLGGDDPENDSFSPGLPEGVNPEAGNVLHLDGEVEFMLLFEPLALLVVEDIVEHDMDILLVQGGHFDPAHLSVDAGHGLLTGADMQVGGPFLVHE
jgi:hypothetical protein